MILFLDDWKKHKGAIADVTTTNKSFLHYVALLRNMKIKNHAFPLALHNRLLQGVDPFDPRLDDETIMMITEEVATNPWYFLREIMRIPISGSSDANVFAANRGNISVFWLFFNHITTYLIQPRQTGKSVTADSLYIGLILAWVENVTIHVITKDSTLRAENIERIKKIIGALPQYLNLRGKKDPNTSEFITVKENKNTLRFHLGQKSEQAAIQTGRGLTTPIFGIDEFAFIYNIDITLPLALSSMNDAVDKARINGIPYGRLFYTTPGYLETKSGKYAYRVYNEAMRWTETLYDLKDQAELESVVEKHSGLGNVVLVEMNHRQLGYTDDWMRRKINEALAEGARAAADFLLKWDKGSTTSALDKWMIKLVDKSIREPDHEEISKTGYILRWYITEEEKQRLKNRSFVIGLDTSDAIGNDDIGFVARDVIDGSTIVAGKFNKTNLADFAIFVFDFMMEYPKSVLIPERKSSGMMITDSIARLMNKSGINVFTRIFNWVVNDAQPEQLGDIASVGYGMYEDNKKSFGYGTSSGGRAARDNLYGETLFNSVKFTGHKTYDKDLANQMIKLEKKNNRIDHTNLDHDDLVIAHMLTFWFLNNARNLNFYGINASLVLSGVDIQDEEQKNVLEKEEEARYREEVILVIEELLKELSSTKNHIIAARLKTKINLLKNKLGDRVAASLNLDARIQEVAETMSVKRKTHNRNIMYQRMGFAA